MSEKLFCSVFSRAEGEPLAGLGYAGRTLLIRARRSAWHGMRAAVQVGEGELAHAIRAAHRSRSRVLFVDRTGASESIPTLMAFPGGVTMELGSDEERDARAIAWCHGEDLSGPADPRPAILCCTDGKTDPCCARFGMATYKALAAAVDPAEFNLLEVSHVGGCRFATNVIALPQNQRYGRMIPEDVPGFLAALRAGTAYLPALRGIGSHGEAEQIATIAALEWAKARGLADASVSLVDEPADDEDDHHDEPERTEIAIPVAVADMRLVAELERKPFRLLDDCPSDAAGSTSTYPRWVLRRLVPDDGARQPA